MYKVVAVNLRPRCWCSDPVELKECKIERFPELLSRITSCFDECEEFTHCHWLGGNSKRFSDRGGEAWILVVPHEGTITRISPNHHLSRSYVYHVRPLKLLVNLVNFAVRCDICAGFVDTVERMAFGEAVGFRGMWSVGVGAVMTGFGISVRNGDLDDAICDAFGVAISVALGVAIRDAISDAVSSVLVYIICDIMSVIWSGSVGTFLFLKCSFPLLCAHVGERF